MLVNYGGFEHGQSYVVDVWTLNRTGWTVSVTVVFVSSEPFIFQQNSDDDDDRYGVDDRSSGSRVGE